MNQPLPLFDPGAHPTCAVAGCAHPAAGGRWCTSHARLDTANALPNPRRQTPGKVGAHHPPPARRAAVLSMPRAGTHRAQLLALLANGPATCAALADATGKSRNQTGARMLELREQGWVEYLRTDAGTIAEAPTDAQGNTGQVQQLTAAARAAMQEGSPR